MKLTLFKGAIMMYENTRGQRAVGYEYKNVTVPHSMESVYADGYANFGWELSGTEPALQGGISTVLKLRRDRQLKNKLELSRLEREFEKDLHEIEKLERRKSAIALGSSLGFGIVGAAFLVGAVFSFIAGIIPLGIVLLIPAIAGWALGYFSSVRMGAKNTEQVTPQIDSHYDAVYQVCERANALIFEADA